MNRPVTALGRCLSLVALGLGGSVAGLNAKSADLSPAARHEQAWLAQPELDRVTEGVELDVQFLATAVAYESNRRRVEAGKRRLAHEPRAAEAAERHAAMLANLGHISHSSPLRGEETAAARLERTGLNPVRVAENVATSTVFVIPPSQSFVIRHVEGTRVFVDGETGRPLVRRTYRELAEAIVDQWMTSPRHRDNLLSSQVRALGCGVRFARLVTGMEVVHAVQVLIDP
ncbi:MAG TPA: CAP domain-containing protein [Opitutaceae bacterium]|nr:CAP domain-containing protein [Opitutaceae bacterium]